MVGCMMVIKEIMLVVGGWAGKKKKKKIMPREPGVSIICPCLNSGHPTITAIVSNASQQVQALAVC